MHVLILILRMAVNNGLSLSWLSADFFRDHFGNSSPKFKYRKALD